MARAGKQTYDNNGIDKILLGSAIWLSDIVVDHAEGNELLTLKLLLPDHETVSTEVKIKNFDQVDDFVIGGRPRGNGPVELLEFSTGFTLDFSNIQKGKFGDEDDNVLEVISDASEHAGVWLYGADGQDTLYGGKAGDVLIGGRHDDQLYGQAGDDIYAVDYGDGRDTIHETGGLDKLLLGPGISHANVAMDRDVDDLVIMLIDSLEQQDLVGTPGNFDHSIRIAGWYSGDQNRVEQLVFADGSKIDIAQTDGDNFGAGDKPQPSATPTSGSRPGPATTTSR